MKRLRAFLNSLRFAPIVTPENTLAPAPGHQYLIIDGYDEERFLANRSERWE